MRRDDILVRSPVIFEYVSACRPPTPAQVELRYAGRDPYAVALAFQTAHSREVLWRFSRELLAQGLVGAAGHGDVRLRPIRADAVLEVELRSPGGRAVFHAPHAALSGYLARTEEIVAVGSEHEWIDLDHIIAMLRLAPPGPGPGGRCRCSNADGGSPPSLPDPGGSPERPGHPRAR